MTRPSPVAWHQKAYVCIHVFEDKRPVLLVSRANGDWCLLCGAEHEHVMANYRVVGIGHILDRDLTLFPLLDLPPEWEAERETVAGSWVRRSLLEPGPDSTKPGAIDEPVRIRFHLDQDPDGRLPFASERLWAKKVAEGTYQLDNIPMFVRDISLGDVVSAEATDAGLVYRATLARSSSSTIRVLVRQEEAVTDLLHEITKCGCGYELDAPSSMIAINVPEESNFAELLRYLNDASREGALNYEESAPRYSEAERLRRD